jgi:hypothetical protein
MPCYTITAHDALRGSVDRSYASTRRWRCSRRNACSIAATICGIDVIRKDRVGRLSLVHHVPTASASQSALRHAIQNTLTNLMHRGISAVICA